MSDTHNHIICAEKTFEKIKNSEIDRIININYSLYLYGSQGGDIYMYYDPVKGNAWADALSECLHNDIDTLIYLFNVYLSKQTDKIIKEKLLSYVFGFITHHALDNRSHPFINSQITSFQTHKKVEVQLDLAYSEEFRIPLKKTELPELSKSDAELIQALHNYIFQNILKQTVPGTLYYDCVIKCRKILALTSKRFFYRLALFIEAFKGDKNHSLSGAFHLADKSISTQLRLNLDNTYWSAPNFPNDKFNLSYPQLLDYAVTDSVKRIDKFIELSNMNIKKETFSKIFGDLPF